MLLQLLLWFSSAGALVSTSNTSIRIDWHRHKRLVLSHGQQNSRFWLSVLPKAIWCFTTWLAIRRCQSWASTRELCYVLHGALPKSWQWAPQTSRWKSCTLNACFHGKMQCLLQACSCRLCHSRKGTRRVDDVCTKNPAAAFAIGS